MSAPIRELVIDNFAGGGGASSGIHRALGLVDVALNHDDGAIELTRTSKDDYWAHIIVHHGYALEDGSTRESARGAVVDSRMQAGGNVVPIPEAKNATQIAVLIRAFKP